MRITRPKPKQPTPSHAKKIFTGEMFDVYQWPQKMFDGSTKTFERLKRADTATVIPITHEGKIIIANESQPGTKASIDLITGRIEEGETALAGAKRELFEETGYQAKEWVLLEALQPVGKIDWVVYYFIAKDCKKIAEQNLDGGEKIKLMYVNFEKFINTILAKKETTNLKVKLLEAKLDPKKMKALQKLLGVK